jgi:sec-independent protein translocase protein TatA
MGFVGGQELLIILAIVIILFGAKKIPELASGLGKGIKEFKKASKEADKEIEDATNKKESEEEKS